MMYHYYKQVALATLPKLSGTLSIFGSLWMIVEVITTPSKRSRVFHRIICSMSIVDLLASSAFFISTWAIPTSLSINYYGSNSYESDIQVEEDVNIIDGEYDDVVWNIGNEATCTIQGFVIQFSLCSSM